MRIRVPFVPRTGLPGLIQNWRHDLLSGFAVSLIALPLCLGIAVASGVPPMAGLIPAIVGGLLIPWFSGSYVTINGPAAGLIVVIHVAHQALGGGHEGYLAMCAAVFIAGCLQILFGLIGAGKLGYFFPVSAIHGMLAAIGVIIISKQIHLALGVHPEAKKPLLLLAEVPLSLLRQNPKVTLVSLVTLLGLIFWPRLKLGWLRWLPAQLVVVLVAVPLGFLLRFEEAHSYSLAGLSYAIDPRDLLLTMPDHILDGIYFPDFSQFWSLVFFEAVVSITLVAGIETLLSALAVDKLDPYNRQTNLNRDLSAVGMGTAVSGLLGGLPLIAAIVRSSANINSNARTPWSNFFHGVFLLLFVLLLTPFIESIPLAALSTLLVYTGYGLAAPRHFYEAWKVGRDQLLVFCVTLGVTLATDLLIGVGVGILTELVWNLRSGMRWQRMFRAEVEFTHDAEQKQSHLHLRSSLTFSNYISFRNQLDQLPEGHSLVIDVSEACYIDHSAMRQLEDFRLNYEERGFDIEVRGMEYLQPVSDHALSGRYLSASAT